MSTTGDRIPTYSVCIATYRRPEMLRDLLQSLLNQVLDEAVDYEIVVVDNDAELSGEAGVRRFAEAHPGILRYFAQPLKNIAITRNLALAEARGAFLFFIDDDEVASPRWMQTLIDCQRAYDADAVFGRIIPRFHDACPDWVRSIFLFNRHCAPTGTPSRRTCSANCLVRADLLAALDGPFDERYGLTGGEDTQMFARLAARGARFVDCYEAEVTEFQPPERTTWEWLRNRAVRTGSLQTRRQVEMADRAGVAALRSFCRGTAYAGYCLAMSLATLRNTSLSLNWRLRALYGFGQVRGVFRRPLDGY